MNLKDKGLRAYMEKGVRERLGNRPTTHQNCMEVAGVARPGKTARDKAKR